MAKTAELEGMEGPGISPVVIEEVEAAADVYAKARDKRMAATKKEVDAGTELKELLHKHADKIGKNPTTGEIRYVYNGGDKDRRVVVLTPTEEKLKVRDVEAFEEVNE